GFRGEPQAVFYLISAWSYPLNIQTRPEGLGVDGRGDPRKGLMWMGGGTPRRFLFVMVLVFKCNFPFFFFIIAQKFSCQFPQLKEKVFLGIYIPKGNNVYFEFIKRYKVFCNFVESDILSLYTIVKKKKGWHLHL
ncbi:unnamed protein product, partial [Staurois parvus]